MIDWETYIQADPEILLGKPVIKGTRLTVDFILDLLANGWTEAELYESYPQLTPEALRAVFAYAAAGLRDESLFLMPPAG